MGPEAPDASMPAASAAHPDACDARAHKSRRLAHPADSKSPEEWVTALCNSRASFLATTAVPEDPAEALGGGLILTPLMGCKARTPLDWTHAWAMPGEWAGKIAFPIPEDGKWPPMGTAFTCDLTTSTELRLFSHGPDPSSNKDHFHRCRSSQRIFPSFAFLETSSFRARMRKLHIASPQ